MKIVKKFEEYEMDLDGGDIVDEYVKLIISTYIDKSESETLESVYKNIIEREYIEEQEYIIKDGLIKYLKNLYEDSKKIREIYAIDADKYNI